jgi:hypothetical protein
VKRFALAYLPKSSVTGTIRELWKPTYKIRRPEAAMINVIMAVEVLFSISRNRDII